MSLLRGWSQRRFILIGGIAVAGIALIAIVLWQVGLFDGAPPPASLESAVESLRDQQEEQQSTEQTQTQTQDSAEPQASEQQAQAAARQSEDASTAADGYGGSSTSAEPQAAEDAQPSADTAMAYEEPQQAESEQPEPPAEQEQQAQPAEPQQTAQPSDAADQDSAVSTPLADLAGTWTLSEQGESFVGYRIGEELAQIGTTTAVGRTGEIVANLVFDGSAITTVEITADLRTLRSDQSFRDGALRTRGLESDTYPWGIFRLTEPIPIDALPSGDGPLSATAAGTLEVHGVTNDVTIALEGRYVDGFVVVVGSTDFVLADYDIEKPTGFRVLSIEDAGVMEFQLVLERTQ